MTDVLLTFADYRHYYGDLLWCSELDDSVVWFLVLHVFEQGGWPMAFLK